MSNGDQLALYSVLQLPSLFRLDASCKFLALKIKQEGKNTALHAVYIAKSHQDAGLEFCALVTVTEWDGKTEKEEFFIEAENVELLLEKLQRFDEINRFIFIQAPDLVTIDTLSLAPQNIFCTLFPELGVFKKNASEEVLASLKSSSLALLRRLDSSNSLEQS